MLEFRLLSCITAGLEVGFAHNVLSGLQLGVFEPQVMYLVSKVRLVFNFNFFGIYAISLLCLMPRFCFRLFLVLLDLSVLRSQLVPQLLDSIVAIVLQLGLQRPYLTRESSLFLCCRCHAL